MLTITVDRIPEEGLFLDEEIVPGDLFDQDLSKIFCYPVNIAFEVRRVPVQSVVLSGFYTTQALLQCSRCVQDFILPIASKKIWLEMSFSQVYEVIDLTPGLREDMILALPIKPLCCTDCKGLCSKCGQNLNDTPCNCTTKTMSSWQEELEKLK